MRAIILSVSTLCLLGLSGCSKPQAEAAAADPKAVLEAIHKAENDQLAALGKHDLAGATAVYAADATMVAPGGAPAKGAQAIMSWFSQALNDPAFGAKPDEGSSQAWVSASGDLAVTSFTADFTKTDAKTGKPVTEKMANQTAWKKAEDGSWKIQSDFNQTYPK